MTDEIRMLPQWQADDDGGMGGALPQLRFPLMVPPQGSIEGFMVFDFMNMSPYLTEDRTLEITDQNSRRGDPHQH